MQKFITVISFVFVLAICIIFFVVNRGNSFGRSVAKDNKVEGLKPFPVTKEKLPEGLVWLNGSEQKPFASPKAKKGGVLHSAMTTFPTAFRQYGPNSNTAFRSYLDDNDIDLVGIHPTTSEYYPGMATAWAIGPDKRTVYFKLDPDVRWSDGEKVTADDYVFALKFLRSESLLAPYTKEYTHKYIERVMKFDDYTIGIRLPQPKADLIYNCILSPKPYHFYGEFRETEAELPVTQALRVLLHDEKGVPAEFQKMADDFRKKIDAGEELAEPKVKISKDDVREDWVNYYQWRVQPRTGPYKIDSWIKGKEIVLKRVQDWWALEKPFFKNRYNVDYINLKLIRDLNIIFEHFKKGDIDSFNLRSSHYWHVKAKYLIPVEKGYITKLKYFNEMPRPSRLITFNMDHKPLDDINVRLGLAHSFNFGKLFKTVLRNDAVRQEAILDGYGKFSSKEVHPRTFDPTKAGEYFDKAGFNKRDSDGVRMNSQGVKLAFKLLYYRESDTSQLILFKEEAKKCGVSFELDNYDSNTVFMSMLDKKHQIAWHGWASGFRPRYWGEYHQDNAHKKKNNNFSNIDDDELSKMINKFRAGKDDNERMELAKKIEKRIYDLVPALPAFKMPYMRYAFWRWIQLPDTYATKTSEYLSDYGLYWIDTDLKKEIKAKMLKGEIIYGTKKLIEDTTYKPKGGK